MDRITTTLARFPEQRRSWPEYRTLFRNHGGVFGVYWPLSFSKIYRLTGYEATMWALDTVDQKWMSLIRRFACDCVVDIYPLLCDDKRSGHAILTAINFSQGWVGYNELAIAYVSARDVVKEQEKGSRKLRAAVAASLCASLEPEALVDAVILARDVSDDPQAAEKRQVERLFKYCQTGMRP